MNNKRNLYYSALSIFDKFFRNFYSGQLRVLAYHDIKDEKLFNKQMLYLNSNYNIINLRDLKNHLLYNQTLPNRSVLITFDDGDFTVLTKAMPILKQQGIPAVLFVISSLIGTSKNFWWSEVASALGKSGKTAIDIENKLKHLKNVSNTQRLEYLSVLETSEDRMQLSISNLKTLQKNGIVIANHSHTHPMFNKCSNKEIEYELKESNKFFEEIGIGENKIFAYPNGNSNERAEKLLKVHGVKMAFLFDHKINQKIIDPLKISRIRVNSDTKIPEFRVKVSGLHSLIRSINFKL